MLCGTEVDLRHSNDDRVVFAKSFNEMSRKADMDDINANFIA